MHVAVADYRGRLSNRRGPAWWRQAARAVRPFLSADQNALLASEIKYQSGFARSRLPRGAIHGDLFCDNVLFEGERVSGIIDFGFAATDAFAYDLAIAVNDWCTVPEGPDLAALDAVRCADMVAAYRAVRPLSEDERVLWPVLCALRRCGSGCRACTTCIFPAPASSPMRMTLQRSSAFFAIASRARRRHKELHEHRSDSLRTA